MKVLDNSFEILLDFSKLEQFKLAIAYWEHQQLNHPNDKITYLDAVKACRATCGDLAVAVAVCKPLFGIIK